MLNQSSIVHLLYIFKLYYTGMILVKNRKMHRIYIPIDFAWHTQNGTKMLENGTKLKIFLVYVNF